MFQSVRGPRGGSNQAEVNIAPLIDMVFILLIFFLVTTSFIRDTGVTVERPQATTAKALQSQSLRIGVAASGHIFVDGQRLSLAQLRDRVRAFLRRERQASVIVVPDKSLKTGRLVEVIDAAKAAGAKTVAIATEQRRR